MKNPSTNAVNHGYYVLLDHPRDLFAIQQDVIAHPRDLFAIQRDVIDHPRDLFAIQRDVIHHLRKVRPAPKKNKRPARMPSHLYIIS